MKKLIEYLKFKRREIQLRRTLPVRQARRALYYFIKDHYEDIWVMLEISTVGIKVKKDSVDYTIYLKRPGLLIGKHGKDINELIKYLKMRLDKKVNIYLKEYSWYDSIY